jgi:hypothetical protein
MATEATISPLLAAYLACVAAGDIPGAAAALAALMAEVD